MKKPLIIASTFIAAFILGATLMYLLTRQQRPVWINVASEGEGIAFETAALNGDIPFPKTTKPSGRVKFLDRDGGERLGYILKLAIKPNPTAALPEKYRRITKLSNGMQIGPPDQVSYERHFEFTFKDADGFVLMKMNSPTEHLSAGSDNPVQGTTEQVVPNSVAGRTKEVDVSFLVTSCNPCEAN